MYGGNPLVVEKLVSLGSDTSAVNAWGCGAGHFLAISGAVDGSGEGREVVARIVGSVGRERMDGVVVNKHTVLHKCGIKKRINTAGHLRVIMGEEWWEGIVEEQDKEGKKAEDWGGEEWKLRFGKSGE